jgi:hypothetical protein
MLQDHIMHSNYFQIVKFVQRTSLQMKIFNYEILQHLIRVINQLITAFYLLTIHTFLGGPKGAPASVNKAAPETASTILK